MADQGLGATKIARQLGIGRASVYRALKEVSSPQNRSVGSQAIRYQSKE
ncbi:helix-turn-helix domain-containing protein [Bradyrhizobium sp. 521_C7_N1_3]|nr:helix-turn-helix domain-containing protein [Bradyrhizobium japonicum]WLB63076.1 helix-turn-helix domain-containing protein [Bradyrhizobium japonicum]